MNVYQDKKILVTGSCGTVGRELVRQLLENRQRGEVVCIDNNESELFFLEQRYSALDNVSFVLADIRDKEKMVRMMRGVDVVFHSAAYKHVSLCERSPFEAVQTNVLGVNNVIQSAVENGVSRVIFTSSDKAVNPTNVMGASKLMGERLITAANMNTPGSILASTRFGNVLGSRGSVIPIFRQQIIKGGPLTVTHRDMTRFIMSIGHAVRLVIESAVLARGGEVFITKMPALSVLDLAEVMIAEIAPLFGHDPASLKIEFIGTKPGEKMFEELMSSEELRRAQELHDFFVVFPALSERPKDYEGTGVPSDDCALYHSGNATLMSKDDIKEFLREHGLFSSEDNSESHPDRRHWGLFPGKD